MRDRSAAAGAADVRRSPASADRPGGGGDAFASRTRASSSACCCGTGSNASISPATARPTRSSALRRIRQAGELLRALEEWLHRRPGDRRRAMRRRRAARAVPRRARSGRSRANRADARRRQDASHELQLRPPAGSCCCSCCRCCWACGSGRAAGPLVLPFDHAPVRRGKYLGRVLAAASTCCRRCCWRSRSSSSPARSGCATARAREELTNIQFVLDVSGSMTAQFGDGIALRRGHGRGQRVHRLPQGRRLRPDHLRQRSAALGADHEGHLRDQARDAVPPPRAHAALFRRHADRQGADRMPEGARQHGRRATA